MKTSSEECWRSESKAERSGERFVSNARHPVEVGDHETYHSTIVCDSMMNENTGFIQK